MSLAFISPQLNDSKWQYQGSASAPNGGHVDRVKTNEETEGNKIKWSTYKDSKLFLFKDVSNNKNDK